MGLTCSWKQQTPGQNWLDWRVSVGNLCGGALCRCVTLKPIGPQRLDALLKVWDLLDKSSF